MSATPHNHLFPLRVAINVLGNVLGNPAPNILDHFWLHLTQMTRSLLSKNNEWDCHRLAALFIWILPAPPIWFNQISIHQALNRGKAYVFRALGEVEMTSLAHPSSSHCQLKSFFSQWTSLILRQQAYFAASNAKNQWLPPSPPSPDNELAVAVTCLVYCHEL